MVSGKNCFNFWSITSFDEIFKQSWAKSIILVTLFEFDQRFESVGSAFHHFDYKRAIEEDYLDECKESFDIILADPPFLAEECIEKLGIVVRKIAKPDCKVVLCSGYVVREWAEKHLKLELCKFEPEHERNLGNQFSSYANFNLDQVLAEESWVYLGVVEQYQTQPKRLQTAKQFNDPKCILKNII